MQIFQPWIQKRRLAYAKHKHVISGILRNLKMLTLGKLFKEDGQPNTDVIERLVFANHSNLSNCLFEFFIVIPIKYAPHNSLHSKQPRSYNL